MSVVAEVLEYNQEFVRTRQYQQFTASKVPAKGVAVLSCMDTRLTELLPAAMGFRNGHVQMIKNAGGLVSHPFGSVMRSLLIAICKFDVRTILVIGHHDCGMQGLDPDDVTERMLARGIDQRTIETVTYGLADFHSWLKGFSDARESVSETVRLIGHHPLVPGDVTVAGFLIDPETGALEPV